jgi:hypothetical protein
MVEKRKQRRLNKIFLIGNGFDLAHGLPTSYQDFIRWYFLECINKVDETGNYEDECLMIAVKIGYFRNRGIQIQDFCNGIFTSGDYVNFVDKEQFDKKSFLEDYDKPISIHPKNSFIFNIMRYCLDQDWGGIEDEIYREIIKNHNTLVPHKSEISGSKKIQKEYATALDNIKILNTSVNYLKYQLIEYLKIHNNPTKLRSELFSNENNSWGDNITKKYILEEDSQRKVLFLNFNYTTYLQNKLINEVEIEMKDVRTEYESISIHGNIQSDLDNVIFGVGDENKEFYSEIESLYDDDWLMSMKSFHYLRNESYQNLLGFIDDGDYEIFVIGHSCSITDRTLLNMLFENDSCQKIHVYHYSGINSYLKTAYNIARNFNDKVRLRKVLQPFNEKLSTK